MSISPSDWSEEARLSMTIDRHQTKNDMRKSCKGTLTLYTEALDPWNKQLNIATVGMSTNLHMRDL